MELMSRSRGRFGGVAWLLIEPGGNCEDFGQEGEGVPVDLYVL